LDETIERPVQFRMSKAAHETENAAIINAAMTVPFDGAKRPKLRKMTASQKTTTSRRGVEIAYPVYSSYNQRIWAISTAMVRA
jgi:hypothetical protein